MTARRRRGTRAPRTRYLPRHAAWTRHRAIDQQTADALAGDDLMALADALHAREQAEVIADCDEILWELELRGAP